MSTFDDYNTDTDIPAGSNGHPSRQSQVAGESVTVQQGAAQNVKAEYVEMYQSGAGSVKANEVHLQDGGAGLIAADHVEVTGSQVGMIVASQVASAETRVVVLLAGSVEGNVETVIDGRTAAIIGGLAAVGLTLAGALVALVLRRNSAS